MTILDSSPAPAQAERMRDDRSGRSPRWERPFCVGVVFVYLTAFALPVFDDTGILANHLGVRPHGSVYGWQAFLVGWFVLRLGWLANLGIWSGMVLLVRRKPLLAAAAGLVALGLGAMYLQLLADHSLLSPQSFLAGYFCWMASAILLAAAGVGLWWLGRGGRLLGFVAATCVAGVALLVTAQHAILVATAPPSESTLSDQLLSGDVAVRRAAARKLGLDHKPELVRVFLKATSDSDDKVRQSAIAALGAIGSPAAEIAVPTLVGILSTPLSQALWGRVDRKRGANSRSAAAAALGSLGPAAKEAIPALAAALKDENIPVRRWSASSLGEMGAEGRSAVPVLLLALGDSDVQVRRYAIESLKRIGLGLESVNGLASALRDPDATVRERAKALVASLRKR